MQSAWHVQVGSLFALCKESGLSEKVRQHVLKAIADGDLGVFTDPVASPTGFPFKARMRHARNVPEIYPRCGRETPPRSVAEIAPRPPSHQVLELPGSLSEKDRYKERPRVCNLGYLRTPYMKPDGSVGYRCASEPVNDWLKKGGELQATEGRKCLCNALMANTGMPQVSPFKKAGETARYVEEILITAGDDVNRCKLFMKQDEHGDWSYTAGDVIRREIHPSSDVLTTSSDVIRRMNPGPRPIHPPMRS